MVLYHLANNKPEMKSALIHHWCGFLAILILTLPFLLINGAYAASTVSSYSITVNGSSVTVKTTMIAHSTAASIYGNRCKNTAVGSKVNGKTHTCCAGYAESLYKKLWNTNMNKSNSATNVLANLSAAERRISVEKLQYFFSYAKPGSDVRFDKNGSYRTDYGHELIFLGLENNGGVFWEGNYDGLGNVRIWKCSWNELYTRFNNKGYIYIPYIMCPNPTKVPKTDLPEEPTISGATYPTAIENGKSFGLRGTVSCKYNMTSLRASIIDGETFEIAKSTKNGI